VIAGDASTTRGDFYFGDNHSFNETLFDQVCLFYRRFVTALYSRGTLQFVNTSNAYGGGYYNQAAAAEVRWNRIQDSQTRNPTFDFTTPRYITAYAESVFPYRFFVDGRNQSAMLDLTVARGFFQANQFPADFYRRNGSFGMNDVGEDMALLSQAHPISPGHNEGAGNYVLNPEDPGNTGSVRLFPLCQTSHTVSYTSCFALVMFSLYQAHQRHAPFVVPQCYRGPANGSQGEHGDILQCGGRSIMHSDIPLWEVIRRHSPTLINYIILLFMLASVGFSWYQDRHSIPMIIQT
jgi:hypothetical protein